MPQKAHIVSFEQAKKASGKARPSVPLSKKQSSRRSSEKTTSRSVSKAPASSTRTTSLSSKPRRTASSSSARSASSTSRPSARTSKRTTDNHVRPKVQTAERSRNVSSSKQTSARKASSSKPQSTRKPTTAKTSGARTSSERAASSRRRESASQEKNRQSKQTLRETIQKRRHSARKKRADRDFDKHVDTSSSHNEEQSSRAAVYQTRMGTSHKRAARMQNVAAGAAAATGHAVRDAGFSWRNSPRFVATVGIVACLIFGCVFLYPAARDYYVATRAQSQLQAEYAAVQTRNDALQQQVNFMSTSEGIEAKAREDYGWVQPGEVAVTVSGLDSKPNNATDVYASIPEGSVAAPETWYSSLLDPLFGYAG